MSIHNIIGSQEVSNCTPADFWFQLSDIDGKLYKKSKVTTVSPKGFPFIVDHFCKLVKALYSDSHLNGVAASDLEVYRSKADYEAENDPLDDDHSLTDPRLGLSEKDAIIVLVPPTPPATPIPSFDNRSKKWSDWYAAVGNAKVKVLFDGDDWETHSFYIQIKRMNPSDIPLDAIPAPVEEYHEFEKSLDVIKLPVPIPDSHNMFLSDFLFIRPDEYELFRSVHTHNRRYTLMIGNPGISKSWFQYKFILLWSRPDIYLALTTQPLITTLQYDSQVNKVFLTGSVEGNLKEMESLLGCKRPKKILRTVGGVQSLLFQNNEVYYKEHLPADLEFFVTEKDIILWEPGAAENPVEYDGINASILATLSPNRKHYKYYARQGPQRLYMPCPSEIQLQLMGQVFRQSVKSCPQHVQVPDINVIHQRYLRYGPYIRPVLMWRDTERITYEAEQHDDAKRLTAGTLQRLLGSKQHVETDGTVYFGLSPRLARYSVDRSTAVNYSNICYALSCEYVLSILATKIDEFDIEKVMDQLRQANSMGVIDYPEFIPYYLVHITVLHAISDTGLRWRARRLQNQYPGSSKKKCKHRHGVF
jgi:hypothetical protein